MVAQTRVTSFSASGGFLENCSISFSPRLTCIIGGRGTCKSTLIETLRFVFDQEPSAIVPLTRTGDDKSAAGMLRATLGAGTARAEVTLGDDDPRAIRLERELDGERRVYVDDVRDHSDPPTAPRIEVLSQGDLQRIADEGEDERRLALVDRAHEEQVPALDATRREAGTQLARIGSELRRVRAAVATLRAQVIPLPELREQLARSVASAPLASKELAHERQQYESRRAIFDAVSRAMAVANSLPETTRALGTARDQLTSARAAIEKQPADEREVAAGAIDAIDRLVRLISGFLTEVETPPRVDLEKIRVEYNRRSEIFHGLKQQEQNANTAIRTQQEIARQVDVLAAKEAELEAALTQEAALIRERSAWRTRAAEAESRLFDLRSTAIAAMNEEYTGIIHLTLRSGTASPAYEQAMEKLLAGSRLRSREQIASSLAATLTPANLIDLVEAGGVNELSAVLGDRGTAARVIGHLSDHAELYQLEAVVPRISLSITLIDQDRVKPIETLSKGQRATALLPLVMRAASYPLLIDQPEDDLDNSFIFRSLIRRILKLKHQRQLILVTHNANIPVLGNAESVVVMQMRSATQADSPIVGTVDEMRQHILDLLEGGAKAFAIRERYYHELLDAEPTS